MKRVLRKAIIMTVVAIWGAGATNAVLAENGRAANHAEAQAAGALTRLKIPLQRDSRGVVRWIEAINGEFTDEALAYLPKLPMLEWLEIGGGSVSPAGLARLKDCSGLKRLYIHDVKLNGDALAWLPSLTKLEALSLQRTGIDGNAVRNLKPLEALAVLNLSDDKISDEDMEQIAGLKKLEVLSLANTAISGAGIARLDGMTSLNELNITNSRVVDGDLEHFLTMPNLRIVYAAGCNISDIAILAVIAKFPMLAIFR